MSDDPRAFSRHPFAAVLTREEMTEMVRGVQCENAPWPFMIRHECCTRQPCFVAWFASQSDGISLNADIER